MEDELARIAPREVVLDNSLKELWQSRLDISAHAEEGSAAGLLALLRVLGVHVSFNDPYQVQSDDGTLPTKVAHPSSLEGLAISLLRHYLQFALRESMPALPSQPDRQLSSSYMQIDAATLHALEIRHAIRPGNAVPIGEGGGSSPLSARGTLLSVLNRTMTPSGHRLLIRTLTAPSTSLKAINARLALVQAFFDREELREELRILIKDLRDVMRMVQRFKGRGGDGRDIWETGRWIRAVGRTIERIQADLQEERGLLDKRGERSEGFRRLEELVMAFRPLDDLARRIEEAIDVDLLMRGVESADEEDAESTEAGGDALVAEPVKKGKGSKPEQSEQRREEREDAMWWIRPR